MTACKAYASFKEQFAGMKDDEFRLAALQSFLGL